MLQSGKEITARVRCASRRTFRATSCDPRRSPFLGAKVANLSPALADELQLGGTTEGVAILDVDNGSIARSVGFQRGDVILEVNGEKIAKTRDLAKAADSGARVWRISVQRGGQTINLVLGG